MAQATTIADLGSVLQTISKTVESIQKQVNVLNNTLIDVIKPSVVETAAKIMTPKKESKDNGSKEIVEAITKASSAIVSAITDKNSKIKAEIKDVKGGDLLTWVGNFMFRLNEYTSDDLDNTASKVDTLVDLFKSFSKGISDALDAMPEGVDKKLENATNVFDSILDITKKSIYLGALSIAAIPAMLLAGTFALETIAIFKGLGKIDDADITKASDVLVKIGEGIKGVTQAAFYSTIGVPFYITGSVAILVARAFVGETLCVFKSLSTDIDKDRFDTAIYVINKTSDIMWSITKVAAIATLSIPLYISGAIGMLGAKLFLSSAMWAIDTISADDDRKKKIDNGFEVIKLLWDATKDIAKMAISTVLLGPVAILASISLVAVTAFLAAELSVFVLISKFEKEIKKGASALNSVSISMLAFTGSLVLTALVLRELKPKDYGNLGLMGLSALILSGVTWTVDKMGVGNIVKGAIAIGIVGATFWGYSYMLRKSLDYAITWEEYGTKLAPLGLSILLLGGAMAAAGMALPFVAVGAIAVGLVGAGFWAYAKLMSLAMPSLQTLSELFGKEEKHEVNAFGGKIKTNSKGEFIVLSSMVGPFQALSSIPLLDAALAIPKVIAAGVVGLGMWAYSKLMSNALPSLQVLSGLFSTEDHKSINAFGGVIQTNSEGEYIIASSVLGPMQAISAIPIADAILAIPKMLVVLGTGAVVWGYSKMMTKASKNFEELREAMNPLKEGAISVNIMGETLKPQTEMEATIAQAIAGPLNAIGSISLVKTLKLAPKIATVGAMGMAISSIVSGIGKFAEIIRGQIPILDADGKVTGYTPIDLANIGTGIGSVITVLIDAINSVPFDENNLTEVEESGFFGLLKSKRKIPAFAEKLKAILPLGEFISGLAAGVSQFSQLAQMSGKMIGPDGKEVPFNLKDVGTGIGAVVEAILGGTLKAIDSCNLTEMVDIETSEGGFLSGLFGGKSSKTQLPKSVAAIAHIAPLGEFINGLASGISTLAQKDEKGRPLDIQAGIINATNAITGIIKIFSPDIQSQLKTVSVSEEVFKKPLEMFNSLASSISKIATLKFDPNTVPTIKSFMSSLLEDINGWGASKDANNGVIRYIAFQKQFETLFKLKSIKNLTDVEKSNHNLINDINSIDTEKIGMVTKLYSTINELNNSRENNFSKLVEELKESLIEVRNALYSNTDAVESSYEASTNASSNITESNNALLDSISNLFSSKQSTPAPAPAPAPISASKSKVSVDLTINGTSGDEWVIRRR